MTAVTFGVAGSASYVTAVTIAPMCGSAQPKRSVSAGVGCGNVHFPGIPTFPIRRRRGHVAVALPTIGDIVAAVRQLMVATRANDGNHWLHRRRSNDFAMPALSLRGQCVAVACLTMRDRRAPPGAMQPLCHRCAAAVPSAHSRHANDGGAIESERYSGLTFTMDSHVQWSHIVGGTGGMKQGSGRWRMRDA